MKIGFSRASMSVMAVAALLLPGCHREAIPLKYDSEAWVKDTAGHVRWRMVDDLTNRFNLGAMTTNEIIALLGPPSLSRPAYMNDAAVVYYVGPRGISKDEGILVFIDRPWKRTGDNYSVFVDKPARMID